jgi:hypothetical protein
MSLPSPTGSEITPLLADSLPPREAMNTLNWRVLIDTADV